MILFDKFKNLKTNVSSKSNYNFLILSYQIIELQKINMGITIHLNVSIFLSINVLPLLSTFKWLNINMLNELK